MAKPILSWTDKRVQKLWNSHACLVRRKKIGAPSGYEYRFCCLDNLPDRDIWQRIGVARLATSGLTITESIYEANKVLANVRIKPRKKVVPGSVSTR